MLGDEKSRGRRRKKMEEVAGGSVVKVMRKRKRKRKRKRRKEGKKEKWGYSGSS